MAYDVLDGFKVVELSMYAFAPACAAVLADWGADVIKIVPATVADPMLSRTAINGLPEPLVDISFMWEQLNRGKRCIGLDVSSPEGREVLTALLSSADVFITNLLPAARARYRVDYADITADNPRIVYARASAHGPEGPQRDQGGFDHTDFWCRSGIAHAASMAVDTFVPPAGAALGDVSSGAFLAGGIAAALLRRERTGKGALVDVSLFGSGLWTFAPSVVASGVYDVDTIPRANHFNQPNPLVNAYRTRDGRLVYLSGIRTDRHVELFFTSIGRPDLLDDPLFATEAARAERSRECIVALDDIFAGEDYAFWADALNRAQIPWALVQTAREAAADPQTLANHYVVPVNGPTGTYGLVASPAQFDGVAPSLDPAPDHGGNVEEILLEAGYDWDAITALKNGGVVN